ncbi:transglycosylase SLT domain-containing protein [Desulfopila sp. IMCC35008]|uniref:transglycosylase SLT domain-containing protein n=1 Tax=Desulfopila sp. IMCC35008 TaxID=2653858 RepID=UPI0013D0D8F5|nr:transglycosylase SLT domain-containing protein [Desulfopila sp. IMCC35008]
MTGKSTNGSTHGRQVSLQLTFTNAQGRQETKVLSRSFRIGRAAECEICIADPVVSRKHAEVVLLADRWWLVDEGSANGLFVNDRRINRLELEGDIRVQLGEGGPGLLIQVSYPRETAAEKEDPLTVTQYQKRYFDDDGEEEAGEHTMMMRQAYKRVQKKQKKRYGSIIAVVTLLFVLAGSVAVYKHLQVAKQRELAGEIFYSMKALELEFAELLESARKSKDPVTIAKVKQFEERNKELEKSYSHFVEQLDIYEKSISPEEKLILRMARTFGECEIFMPEDFADEVMRYIEKWKSTRRFANAVARARQNGYSEPIAGAMLTYNLPPQFYYLAMQESNFNVNACGPKTRWGIAKGMWQFIPSTAKYYGLQTGPLAEVRKPDPNDDRHNFYKSTRAAAKYLRTIYDTDAQASGLLVMASYNWGETRVNRLLREMPENPQERNFWKFLEKYREKIPQQTYDYVFYIFSAAVIGENPRLFGFDMDNPLGFVES